MYVYHCDIMYLYHCDIMYENKLYNSEYEFNFGWKLYFF